MGEHGGHPAPIEQDPDQTWFWAEEWQAGEREADIQQAASRGIFFDSDEEFVRALQAVMYAGSEIRRAS